MRSTWAVLGIGAGALLAGCASGPGVDVPDLGSLAPLQVATSAFDDGGALPTQYTCDGAGDFPALTWASLPDRTLAVAVIVYDPDAPGGDYVHRIVTNLDPAAGRLDDATTPDGALELETSQGGPGWVPPCPPKGDDAHRYVFAVYALDRPTRLPDTAHTQTAVATVTEAAVAAAQLTATFSR